MVQDTFEDSRIGSNKQHQLVPLLRQSIYSRLAGDEDANDAEWLSVDRAMRHVVGGRAALTDKHAASTSEVGRQRDGNPQHRQQPEEADGEKYAHPRAPKLDQGPFRSVTLGGRNPEIVAAGEIISKITTR